jgi:hypothetical protein
MGCEGVSRINEPIETDGDIAYNMPKFEKSLLTWSHTSNTLLSGDTLGALVELYVCISLPALVAKHSS